MSSALSIPPKSPPRKFNTVVLGDVEVESVIMRDPEGATVPESAKSTASAARAAYFYFRMPGGAWMLEETIDAALNAAVHQNTADFCCANGFYVGWRQGDPMADSAVSVWPTLAPRSAIEIDQYPRICTGEKDDEKDKVFRIRPGHVTGWMQRAIEGLPVSVVHILNALRAFGLCYQFYKEKLKPLLGSTDNSKPGSKDCREWLEILKTTLYAYIADKQDPTKTTLGEIGGWLHSTRNPSTVPGGGPSPPISDLLQENINWLMSIEERLLQLEQATPSTVSSPTSTGTNTSAPKSNDEKDAFARKRKGTTELKDRIQEILKVVAVLDMKIATQQQVTTILAEYALVLSMKTQLVRLSVWSKEWSAVLDVEESKLTGIGDQLWHVCNQLCCSYYDAMRELQKLPVGCVVSPPPPPAASTPTQA